MKNLILFLALISIPILFSSCVTILSGTTDAIQFKSSPAGANVSINGITVGTTDTTIIVNRIPGKYNPIVKYELQGYKTAEFYLERKIDPKYWLNFLNVFMFGVVDIANGAYYMPKFTEWERQLEVIPEE